MSALRVPLADAEATARFGTLLARALRGADDVPHGVIALSGDLGSGKTALARAILQALGAAGPVRSPTYTLVEPYELTHGAAWHLDLYRLGDPEELEFLGVRDIPPDALMLVEWPERAGDRLPPPDLRIELREAEPGRELAMESTGSHGVAVLRRLEALLVQAPHSPGVF